ncbi:MAG: MBOAT family protein [Acidimicrobiia bacterium]|nr:MBOAT family protein [Acidimicrobiia bacterium]
MVFSSVQFLFFFLPVVLGVYFASPKRARNAVLLVASLLFYLWGAGELVALLLCSILVNYGFGLAVGAAQDRGDQARAKLLVGLDITVNLALLGYFKYANFFVAQIDDLFDAVGVPRIELGSIALPIGISFFTFHGLSYTVDVYRRRCRPLRSLVDFGLYMTLFPQLVAGPIVRYHEIQEQFRHRTHSLDDLADGASRFIWGLAKKVVVADAVAEVANGAFGLDVGERSFAAAWLGVLAYTLQIYFDFSGYSDMAIGLARMFGFRFPENFNRPYSSYSITDFWRRWHITLSNWFRDYLYIPLGGNAGGARTYANLLIVFFATGLWHGANWTFVIWGLYHGGIMLVERVTGWRFIDRAPHPALNRAVTLLLVAVGWVLFRAPDVHTALDFYRSMLNPFSGTSTDLVTLGLGRRNLVVLLLGSAVFFLPRTVAFGRLVEYSRAQWVDPARIALVGVALPYTAVIVISGTFSPFLYFQF